MSPRTGLLGVAGVFATTGLAIGNWNPQPPTYPLVEGREPNPVIREFYEVEKPIDRYEAAPVVPSRFEQEVGWIGEYVDLTDVWEFLLDQLTFPLGTAPMLVQPHSGG